MLEFSGHGQGDRTQRVAGGADGVGGLLGMTSLMVFAAARTNAGFDVELGDDGHDGRQVGLVLHDDARIAKRHMAVGTLAARHVDDAIDLLGSRGGPLCCLVPFGPAWVLALA